MKKIINFVRAHGMLCYDDIDIPNAVTIEIECYNIHNKLWRREKFIAFTMSDAREILGY